MAEDTLPTAGETVVRRPLWQRVLKWVGIALAALVLLVVAIVLGINTDPGRRFVADKIGGYTTASGLNIKVGRIDGSLYGKLRLSDVRVSDPKGVFLTSPRLDLDWRWHGRALELGCMMSINPDAHSTDEIDLTHWGVEIARKGGVPATCVLNCLPLEKIATLFRRRRKPQRRAA